MRYRIYETVYLGAVHQLACCLRVPLKRKNLIWLPERNATGMETENPRCLDPSLMYP
jgi:hypothetical protein